MRSVSWASYEVQFLKSLKLVAACLIQIIIITYKYLQMSIFYYLLPYVSWNFVLLLYKFNHKIYQVVILFVQLYALCTFHLFGLMIQVVRWQLVNHVYFSPDGQWIASASFDKSVKLWNGTTGKFVTAFRGHVGPVYQIRYNIVIHLISNC